MKRSESNHYVSKTHLESPQFKMADLNGYNSANYTAVELKLIDLVAERDSENRL